MRIWNYNKERPDKKRQDIYLKFGLFGLFAALFLIGGVKVFIFGVNLLIKYWLWAIIGFAVLLLIRHFFFRRKKERKK